MAHCKHGHHFTFCDVCDGEKIAEAESSRSPAGSIADPLQGKYGDVLRPFLTMMEKELHINAGKGDRPGWLSMTPDVAMLEIYYHSAKLQKAVKKGDLDGVREYAADVANMAMMMVDVCGGLSD